MRLLHKEIVEFLDTVEGQVSSYYVACALGVIPWVVIRVVETAGLRHKVKDA